MHVSYFRSAALTCTSTPRLRGFFARPCKHYPLTDSYVTGAACAEADTTDKEDDPNNEDGGGNGDGETVIDVGDAADAEAVIAQLMRHTAGDGEGAQRARPCCQRAGEPNHVHFRCAGVSVGRHVRGGPYRRNSHFEQSRWSK